MAHALVVCSDSKLFLQQGMDYDQLSDEKVNNVLLYKKYIFVCEKLTNHIHVIDLVQTNDNYEFVTRRKLKVSNTCISSACIGLDRNQKPVLVWYDNIEKRVFLIDIELFLEQDNDRVRIIDLKCECDFDDYNKQYLFYKDMFFYLIGTKYEVTTCLVFSPDWNHFGSFDMGEDHVLNPFLVGKDIWYASNTRLVRLDTTTKAKTILYTCSDKISAFTLTSENKIFIMTSNKVIAACLTNSETGNARLEVVEFIKEHLVSKHICEYVLLGFGLDFRHELSCLTDCHVHTFFNDQLNANERWYMSVLSQLSKYVFNFDVEYLRKLLPRVFGIESLHQNQECLYMGNDIADISNIPRCMFKKCTNFQLLDHDMYSLASLHDCQFARFVREFSMTAGMQVMPTHAFSGKYHITLPRHGKGWHHNIENVPNDECEVTYFVCTNVNEFGGSFFYYRHPSSHKIHAIPDINYTMKKFFLTSNPLNPLWHAIGSFTAIRLSIGFSKLSDMVGKSPWYGLHASPNKIF